MTPYFILADGINIPSSRVSPAKSQVQPLRHCERKSLYRGMDEKEAFDGAKNRSKDRILKCLYQKKEHVKQKNERLIRQSDAQDAYKLFFNAYP